MKSNNSLILFVLLLGVAATAEEAQAQRTGLFSFNNFQQWVDLNYNYDGQRISGGQTPASSSSQHRFDEKYHFSVDYTVYDRRILQGIFTGDLDLNQEATTSSSNSSHGDNVGVDYSMAGELLNRSLFPIHFSRLHQRTYIQQSFIPSYTLLTDSNYLDLYLKNKFLPFRVSYTNSNNETTGLVQDRNQSTNIVNVEAHHVIKDLSKTDFTLSSYTDRTVVKSGNPTPDTRKYELTLRNVTLLGDKSSNRTLDTHLLVAQFSSVFQDKTFNLTEILNLPLGKALNSGGDFSYANRETIFDGAATNQTTSMEHGWLQHQLFESLSTRLDLNGRQDKLSSGNEDDVSGGVGLNYVKKLPWQGSLQLNLTETFQITDRDLGSPTVPIKEEHVVKYLDGSTVALDDIELFHTDVDPDVPLTVINTLSTSPNFNVTYQKDVDYILVTEGNRTKIRFVKFDRILVGDKLLVSYSYLVSPQVKYATTSTRASGTAFFRDGRYRIFGSWAHSSQDLISGRAEAVKLSDSKVTNFGFETSLDATKYGATVEVVDSTQDQHQAYSGYYSYKANFGRSSGSINLMDRYVVTDSVASIGSTGSSVNSSNVSLNYNRPFLSTGNANFTANYTKSLGSSIDRDDISLIANLRWVYGKLNFSLLGQQDWRISGGQTTRNDQVRVVIVRYF